MITLEEFEAHANDYQFMLRSPSLEYDDFVELTRHITSLTLPIQVQNRLALLAPFIHLKELTFELTNRSVTLSAEGLEKTSVKQLSFGTLGSNNSVWAKVEKVSNDFGTSCTNIKTLTIRCAFQLDQEDDTTAPLHFPSLHEMDMGEKFEHVSETVSFTWCTNITSLKVLRLRHMPTDTPIVRIAPNAEELWIYDVPFTTIPIGWLRLKKLKSLGIKQAKMRVFPIDILVAMEALQHLELSNHEDETSARNGMDFRESGIEIDTGFKNIRSIHMNNVPMHHITFRSYDNGTFGTLEAFFFHNFSLPEHRNRIHFTIDATTPQRIAEMFPVLHHIELYDRNVRGREIEAYLPPQTLAFPAMVERGYRVGIFLNPEDPMTEPLKREGPVFFSNDTSRSVFAEGLTARMHRGERYPDDVPTSRLLRFVENNNNPVIREYLQQRDQRLLEMYQYTLPLYQDGLVDDTTTEANEYTLEELLGLPNELGKRKYRNTPYFIKWNAALPCNTTDPFDGETACNVCKMPFDAEDKQHHEEEGEILNNDFLNDASAIEEDWGHARLGCVVVCNITKHDIEENQKIINRNAPAITNPDVIQQIKCSHYHHFFHRTCYSKLLNHKKPSCPVSRMIFFNELNK